ncbi:MAG TPA: transposase, partial [Noviherbaspirillum sp.]|nr:transposase [Noviherbaspirillum sp.]
KSGFSRLVPRADVVSASRLRKGERGIWQRRYGEHVIRDERDLRNHLDYIHYNHVKHGYVKRALDWPHSSFHRYVARGVYPSDWGGSLEGLGSGAGE